MPDIHDLGLILKSRVPIIVIETHEEQRALQTLTRLSISQGLDLYTWSVTAGLCRQPGDVETGAGVKTSQPDRALSRIKNMDRDGLFVLLDFHPYLEDDPTIVRLIKDLALAEGRPKRHLVFISHRFDLPAELHRLAARFQLRMPNEKQLEAIVKAEAQHWSEMHRGARVRTDRATLERLVFNLRGLTLADARRVVRKAIYDDGAITEADLPTVNQAKFELMNLDGVLHYELDTAKFSEVGGFFNLKRWVEARALAFRTADRRSDLDAPKGVMLIGVQGGGKSLAAKAVAGIWGLPLLRLDFASLYNKFYGETERNLREALALAERMAPCVLWMDELEKGIATDGNDGGTSRRVLGTLLTWMAERTAPVFIVATSNDISRLPPELIRKGRLDEIFFVDLPDEAVRAEIFRIHLEQRGIDYSELDLSGLAGETDGFSGAEIEQAVVSALYQATAEDSPLNQGRLESEIRNTRPLSVVMAEPIRQLRAWAQGRTVPVG
ncbi:MAG: AAA family ATPase [Pseudomonadota bacterium]|nr:AAA family ATPase [Pseudomonadota bacterium]